MTMLAAGLLVLGSASSAFADTTGAQRFLLIFRGPAVTPVAIAVGPISGVGTYDPVADRIDFPSGSVFFQSHMTTNEFTPDPYTCTATVSQAGTWQISGGTAAFAGASGQGTATTLAGRVVGVRGPDGCSFGAGAVGVVVVQLTGTVSVATTAAA